MTAWRLAGCASLVASALGAQSGPPLPRITNEAQVNARWSRSNALEVGWSVIIPASPYIRTSLTAATGRILRDQVWQRESRYEITTRFLLDPFRQSRYGLSFGAGAGTTNSDGLFGRANPLGERPQRWRPFMAVIADLELRKSAGLTPAVQVGIGSGIRAGLVVRSAMNRWR
jgi:hypothetical protein